MQTETIFENMNIIPLPIALFNLKGKVIGGNDSGVTLLKSFPKNFYNLHFSHMNNKREHKLVVQYDNENYFCKALKVNNSVCIIFIKKSLISQLYDKEQDMYQATINDLQTIFDISYDVLYVTDGDGNTLRVSSAAKMLWGTNPNELIGKNIYELEGKKTFYPSATRIAIEKGEPHQLIQQTKVGRTLMVMSTPIKDKKGNIVRVVNASKDITEIQALEEELAAMKLTVEGYRNELAKTQTTIHNQLVYRSKEMAQLVSIIPKVAAVNSTILITGESGVGKEVIVNYIHQYSNRVDDPFIKINCAAIPESLLESELFGYEKGAFTGAHEKGKAGLFELAHKGTIFLDEIGDMPLNLQAKLLRVLQEGEVMRIGGSKPINVDVRILAATNHELIEKVDDGLFRKDLYYRLNVIPIHIMPLRERRDDIIPLIHYFIELFNKELKSTKVFSQELLNSLENYHWPGNIRELQNVVERLIVTSDNQIVDVNNTPAYILNSFNTNDQGVDINQKQPAQHDKQLVEEIIPIKEAVEKVEADLLKKAASQCNNYNEMATLLKVNQSTISRKMQKYNLSITK